MPRENRDEGSHTVWRISRGAVILSTVLLTGGTAAVPVAEGTTPEPRPEVAAAGAIAPEQGGGHGSRHVHGPVAMRGLPGPMFYGSAVGVLLLSFGLFDHLGRRARATPRRSRGLRVDLLDVRWVGAAVKRPAFQLMVQIPFVLLFVLILATGFLGNPDPQRNLAPLLTWTIWWAWLVFLVLFVGKAWCTVCPWMAIADWMRRIRARTGFGAAWGARPWPRGLRNIWVATVLFVLLTWLELGFGVTARPRLTALLGVLMLAAAVGTVVVFERNAFCRYACLVGRVSGLYAMFGASEVRATDRAVCRTCRTKDCYRGNARAVPCPTHEYLGAMDRNTYCIMCSECVRGCPHDNVSWNVRRFGADLLELRRVRVDEAYLAVILLAMSAFHGLTMTPTWDGMVAGVGTMTGLGVLGSFSVGMAVMLTAPIGVFLGVCRLMQLLANDREHPTRTLFVRFAYSLLPIALFYHLAHNLQHMLYEGARIVRLVSDPFGWGWDLFGTASVTTVSVLRPEVTWWIQVGLILTGHVFGILIAHRVAFGLYDRPAQATRGQLPMLAVMLVFSVQSLWLLAQPMVMRSAM